MSAQKPTMLIVEDEHLISRLLLEVLRTDFNIFLARNATWALSIARTKCLDIVLADQVLPDRRGHLLLGAIQSMQDVPSIIMTGYPVSDIPDEAWELPYLVGVLEKPFSVTELPTMFSMLLSGDLKFFDRLPYFYTSCRKGA